MVFQLVFVFVITVDTLNSLTAMGRHDGPFFNKLCAHVISPQIFGHRQHLIAGKLVENVNFLAVYLNFNEAWSTNNVSRVSVSCFFALALVSLVGL